MRSNVLCLFLYYLVSGLVSLKFVQSSQCNDDQVFGKEFFEKTSHEDLKNFSDFLAYGYKDCTASNLSYTKHLGRPVLKWCFITKKHCFVWNCSCSDDISENPSLRPSSTSFECSGNVIREDASEEQSTVQMNGDPNCDNTTSSAQSAKEQLNKVQKDSMQTLAQPIVFILGTIVGSVLTFCAIKICRIRKRRAEVTDHSTFSDEIPLCDRNLKANQDEKSQCNNEMSATPVYTEITENIHCDQRQLVSSAVISNGEYLEPVDRHLIQGRSGPSAALDSESANVYSHVYNHLNTNHDKEIEACYKVKVTDHIYNVSITDKKANRDSEKETNALVSAFPEEGPTTIRRRSFDKPQDLKDCADDAMPINSSCTTNSKEMENNKYEELEKTDAMIKPDLNAQICDEKPYFVLEKRKDNNAHV